MQLSFDILDTNNDDRVSELDLFKLMSFFDKGSHANKFNDLFLLDYNQIMKYFNEMKNEKINKYL